MLERVRWSVAEALKAARGPRLYRIRGAPKNPFLPQPAVITMGTQLPNLGLPRLPRLPGMRNYTSSRQYRSSLRPPRIGY